MNYGWQFYKNYYSSKTVELEWAKNRREHLSFPTLPFSEKPSEDDKKKHAAYFKHRNQVFEKQKPNLQKDSFFENKKDKDQKILLKTTYPGLILGTGYGHETGMQGEMKLGFFFDYTTGLPVIPGSSVKGKLRSVFPHFKTKANNPFEIDQSDKHFELKKQKAKYIRILLGKDDSWNDIPIHKLELAIFEGVDLAKSNGAATLEYLPMRQHDVFHDAFVSEVSKTLFEFDSITPHTKGPLKNPIPIAFMKIAPNVTFQFNFDLKSNNALLEPNLKIDLFTKILEQQGIGAKTNVGYGQFQQP
jgi:CRISPR-associated protein Cmr6